MGPIGFILAVSLGIGALSQSCDVGDFSIDDFSDQLVVTNASPGQGAQVLVESKTSSGELFLAAGASRTIRILAATKYSVTVIRTDLVGVATYRQSLLDLRDQLQDLSITPEAPPGAIANALTDLLLVESALQQLQSNGLQTCSHAIVTGVDSRAIMTWTVASGGTGLWVLDCA